MAKIITASIYLGRYERNVGEPIHIGVSSASTRENFFLAKSSSIKSLDSDTSSFDQPTRAGMVSHLTYNEYPLELLRISILDEKGLRTKKDYSWIHGNAEHSWGLLH